MTTRRTIAAVTEPPDGASEDSDSYPRHQTSALFEAQEHEGTSAIVTTAVVAAIRRRGP